MSLCDDFRADPSALDQLKVYRPPLAVNFNPRAWTAPSLLDVTGPYAYALNLPQIGEAKPGFLFLRPCMDGTVSTYGNHLPQTPEDLEYRLTADDLFFHGEKPPESGHTLAFASKPASFNAPAEILCLRRDSNNLWSYREITEKGGCRKPHLPRQIDFAGQPIRCPSKADLGPFRNFLGFASLPYDGVFYYRRVVLPDNAMQPFFRAVPASVKLGICGS